MKYWIFIAKSGMPMKVEKCDFCPTLCPCPGDWFEVVLRSEIKDLQEKAWKYDQLEK